MIESVARWGLLWYSKNKLDGVTQHIIYDNYIPVIFKTRKNLRVEPHGWRYPKPVRVKLIVLEK